MFKGIQKLSELLQNEGQEVNFTDVATTVADALDETSVYVFGRKGKLLGYSLVAGLEGTAFDAAWLSSGVLPDDLAAGLMKIGALSTGDDAGKVLGAPGAVAPIVGAGRRVGTLVLVGLEKRDFTSEELTLVEFAATTLGLIIATAMDGEEEDEAQEKQMARSAIRSLSYSEILAMQHIFDELQGDEGLLVASRIADQAGITRSVIVNALRKLASANVIESRSLGMKGTYLRVLNPEVRNELNRQRYPYLSGNALLQKQA